MCEEEESGFSEIHNQTIGSMIIPKRSKNKNAKKSFNEENDGIRSTQSSNQFDHINFENRSTMTPAKEGKFLRNTGSLKYSDTVTIED